MSNVMSMEFCFISNDDVIFDGELTGGGFNPDGPFSERSTGGGDEYAWSFQAAGMGCVSGGTERSSWFSSVPSFSGGRASRLPPHVEMYVELSSSTRWGVVSRLLLSATQR